MEPVKDTSVEAPCSSSSSTAFSYDLKLYLYELVRRFFVDNQIREERIMAQIDSMAKKSEENRKKLKGELKGEMQNSEARVIY